MRWKVKELRKQTDTEIIMFSQNDLCCAHPNHPRTWYSRNLWCGTHEGTCPRCQSSCCAVTFYEKAYEKAIQRGETFLPETERMQRLLKEIRTWIPSGSDESTFMECTECHKLFCPKCCSVCPHPSCGDRMCHVSLHLPYAIVGADFNKDCNENRPWTRCSLHD